MSQDSNTTDDTNSKPRLQVAHPSGAPTAAENASPAPDASAAVPRFYFSRKKKEEVAPAPVALPAAAAPGRPSGGSKLFPVGNPAAPAGSLPAPSAAAPRATTAAPFSGKGRPAPHNHVKLWIAIGILALAVGAESAYILMHDEKIVEENRQRPPVVVNNSTPGEKPIDVAHESTIAPSPTVAFLQSFDLTVASGSEPRIFVNNQTFHLGDVVAPNLGLKWTHINDQTRELEFTDKQGHRYVKKF